MGFLWTVTGLWALLLSFGISAAFHEGGLFGLAVMLVGWGPLGLLIWFVFNRATKREAAHAAMLNEAGVQPSSGCDHTEKGAGIAINKQAKTLTMLINGFWKTYPYADVRGWETRKERAGEVVGVGLAAGTAALGANVRAERAAAANTGLFVTVKDVENPKWRIEMRDDGIQARWMEILTQEINER